MKALVLIISIVLLPAVAAVPSLALAQSYEWTDDRGVRHWTDDVSRVPQQYRDKSTTLPDVTATPEQTRRHEERRAREDRDREAERKEAAERERERKRPLPLSEPGRWWRY